MGFATELRGILQLLLLNDMVELQLFILSFHFLYVAPATAFCNLQYWMDLFLKVDVTETNIN